MLGAIYHNVVEKQMDYWSGKNLVKGMLFVQVLRGVLKQVEDASRGYHFAYLSHFFFPQEPKGEPEVFCVLFFQSQRAETSKSNGLKFGGGETITL